MSDSIWRTLGTTLRDKGLPLLGAAVGGPAGATLGGMLARALGSTTDNPETLLQQINAAPPELIAQLRELEHRHSERLEEIALDTTKAFLADRQSARQREAEVVKATGKKDINLYLLAWLVVLGFISLTAVISYVDIPETNSQAAFMLYGGLVSGFSSVLGYFFGSSQGSAAKNDIMERLQTQLQQLQQKAKEAVSGN